jgi:putative acetyltransferase
MHTTQSARRRGVGGAMLRHIIASARQSGMSRLSLEAGSWEYFRSAQALYRSHGFVECAPFADYVLGLNHSPGASDCASLLCMKSEASGGSQRKRRRH